jgi:hypothetical protein
MSFIRKIKTKSGVYLSEVENYREGGKVRQRHIRYIGKEVESKASAAPTLDGIEVLGVKSYLDYKILHDVAMRLGLPVLLGHDSARILLLVYTQLIARKALYKLPEYVEHTALDEILGLDKLVDKQLYQALDELNALDFQFIEESMLEALLGGRQERKAMVIDVTDTYFNGSRADWKRRKGKDGKFEKLIQVALAVTQDEGGPILHKTYEGNIGNVKIFEDMLAESRLNHFDIVVVDRGMCSQETLDELIALEQKVIAGLKLHDTIKNECIAGIDRETIFQPEHRVKLKETEVYAMEFDYHGGKLIAVYNPALEAEKRRHAMEKNNYKPENARYMGYSAIYHSTGLSAKEVVKTYFERDIAEKACRQLKTSINLQPVCKYRLDRVGAHVKICYMAYAILSYIQNKVKPAKMSATTAIEILQSAYKVEIRHEEQNLRWQKVVTLKNDQKKILKLLDCGV